MHDLQNSYHLVFIDQLQGKSDNKLFKVVEEQGYPFASVDCLPTKSELGSKRLSRKYGFQILKGMVNDLSPIEVITGNDRRVEFQYSMDCARALNASVKGGFIDDGTGSYVTFQDLDNIKLLGDKYIDTFLKKIMYGSWYERPERFGSSKWVDNCYLTHPEQSPHELKNKNQIKLNPKIYLSDLAIQYFSTIMALLSSVDSKPLVPKSTLILMPHSSLLMDLYGNKENFISLISKLEVDKKHLYFKYHPRELGDPLELSSVGNLLKTYVPAELYFSISEFDCVIGDVSTALLSAKWLRPESQVNYFPNHSKFTKRVEKLFLDIGIKALDREFIT